MHKEKIKTYISSIFAWSFLSFALFKLSQALMSNVMFISLIVIMSTYLLYLFYLWIRIKSRPTYLEYFVMSVAYSIFFIGFTILYNMIFKRNAGNEFNIIGYPSIAIFIFTMISSTVMYWLVRLVIKIFS